MLPYVPSVLGAQASALPPEIFIDVDARLNLRFTGETPSTERVTGRIRNVPAEGLYQVVLMTTSGTPFALLTGLVCVVIIILVILDWPKPAEGEAYRRARSGLPPLVNFLDITNGEYSGSARLDFEDGFAEKSFEMRRVSLNQFRARVETTHAYPRSKTEGLVRLLPTDLAIDDAGPGRACGRSQLRWLTSQGGLLTGDFLANFRFENQQARIPFAEVFTYDYTISDTSVLPLVIDSVGVMRGVC